MATIVLTGGGTAGHVIPNISLLPYLKRYFQEIIYIGSENGLEKNLILNEGIKFYSTETVKFKRSLSLKNFLIPFKLLKGIRQAGNLLDTIKPNVIFSKGGYVALPTVIAAKKRKIPVICHESDLTVGLSNKISSRFSSLVLTSFKETESEVKNGKFVGPPLRKFVISNKEKAKKRFGFTKNLPTLLIIGGSLGAKSINNAFLSIAKDVSKKFNIIHVTGKGNLSNVRIDGYFETEFLNDIDSAYSIADLAITRAGSNTLFELLSNKIPCLAIPLPKGASRGDQILNAEYFSYKGAIMMLKQENLTPNVLFSKINLLYENKDKYLKAIKNLNVQSSCEKIAEILNQSALNYHNQ